MSGFAKKRRLSREFAFKFLYQRRDSGGEAGSDFESFAASAPKDELPEDREFARELACGVCREIKEIDSLIGGVSVNWTVGRMSPVDVNIMRVAVYEMVYMDGINRASSINEAVEMAKKYGAEKSAGFVNGVLDKIGAERKDG